LAELGVDGRLIENKCFKKKILCNGDWINMAQDRNKRWALVSNVMNIGLP
jgi:hypothetical protein